MDGLLNYLIPLWRDSMSSSPASAVSSVGFAELRSDGDFKVLRKAKLWSILGCLLQPGLLLDKPPKSLRANSFQLIKFCCTRTYPAAETKSIGLHADASAGWRIMVFATPPRQFYLDVTTSYRLTGFSRLDNFIVTRKSCPLTKTLQKQRNLLI